jgi:phosphoribosyl 1,2-cyclic phosphate phosphodiesterase
MKGKLLFLGTGGSLGVPIVGCECMVCSSSSPFNKRFRPSALIEIEEKRFLIDAGPDFRSQLLKYQIKALDGVLLTHAHHDHTAGVDDLRVLYYRSQRSLPLLLSGETAEEIKLRYSYIFQSGHAYDQLTPRLTLQLLPDLEGEVTFEGFRVQYVTYKQGGMSVNGFRFGDFAYLSDIRDFSPTIFNQLKGVKTLVISALRHQSSRLHFSVDEAVSFADELGVKKGWITHISHELDHDETNKYLPPHIRVAYDGLQIDFG